MNQKRIRDIYSRQYYQSREYEQKEQAIRNLYGRLLAWGNVLDGRGKTALDVGAAFGHVVRLLEGLGYLSAGLELSPIACEEAHLGSRMFNADATNPPFKSNSFDLVTMFETIEHLDAPELAIRQMHRILKPNGILILTTPTPFGNRIILLYEKLHGQDEYHPSVKSWNEWVRLLENASFRDCRYEFYSMTPRLRGRYRLLMNPWPLPAIYVAIQATKRKD